MSYSTNPNLPKARAVALKLLLIEELPLLVVARECGVHRSTIWRWKRKWHELNRHVQIDNPNRPTRPVGASKLVHCRWSIATEPSRPRQHPWSIPDDIVDRILAVRQQLKRCAEVIWHHLNTVLHIRVSLSSVRRILRRHHCFDGARKPRVRPDNPRRPQVTKPGELVQTDTIHHVDPHTGKRLYCYTVIDLHSRMAYAVLSDRLRPGLAAQAVLGAQKQWGFPIAMVQADNGPECGRYFEQVLTRAGVSVRHSRLHRPNDNAHIERFNRTIQTECIGYHWRRNVPLHRQQQALATYLDYYKQERIHLGIQMRTPRQVLQRF